MAHKMQADCWEVLKKTVRTNKNIAATGIVLLLEPDSKAASIGSQIENSSYKNISVTAPTAAGGFVGYIDNDAKSSLMNTDTTEMIVGQASQIGTTEKAPTYAGGLWIHKSIIICKFWYRYQWKL